jgi:SSS family solute:Na+ symporter
MGLRWLDVLVVAAYMMGMVAIGLRFARRQTTTETYFVAKRSIPAWAVGMSMLATIISAVTFIAYPGAGYAGDWSLLVPGIMIFLVLALGGLFIIPFYRQAVGMSVYEYFGRRFGYFARAYSSLAFAIGTFTKMAFVLYLLALTMSSITGWRIETILLGVGVVTVFYTLLGGLEAVIWADVIQGFILWFGIIACIAYLLFLPPGGPVAVWKCAEAAHKFNLGNPALDFSRPTIIVLCLYGFFFYLQKYAADQTMVQRYLASKSDRDALKGVAMGAVLCIPAWILFMLIGTLLWTFYHLTGEVLPSTITKADQVFPHFITTHIPSGLAGLFIASLLGAAMATLSSDLNCLSVVAVEDFYRRIWPRATDRKQLRAGKCFVAVYGAVAIWFAIQLAHTHGTALSLWYTLSAIVAGGLAGLFLLAFLCPRANKQGAYIGIAANLIFTTWATLTLNGGKVLNLGRWNFPFHDYMIGVIGHVLLLVVGYFASYLFPKPVAATVVTFWEWKKRTKKATLPEESLCSMEQTAAR